MTNNAEKFYLQLEEEISTSDGRDFEDRDLLEKSLDNPRLFEIFVDRYQEVFLRTVMRVLKSREESEDVVQEAFVKIYFNAKKYKEREGVALKSWAFKILMNCAFTKYKKLKKKFADTQYMDQLLYLCEGERDNTIENKEKRDEIESVLNKMPEDLSTVIREHYLNDRPYAEIAQNNDMSVAALKMKLFRARKKFKEVIEEIS